MGTAEPYPGPSTEPLRHPGGTPDGGRFATTSRQEPDVTLAHLSDEEYNADGTFEFPPMPRSVEQHVAFWSRVPVPDPIIARARVHYGRFLGEWRGDQLEAWQREHPVPPRKKDWDPWRAARDAAAAEIDSAHPSQIPTVIARPLIRAAQMARYAKWFQTQEEYDEVMASPVDVGTEEPWTVQQTLDVYMLDQLPDVAFEDAGHFSGVNLAGAYERLSELVQILDGSDGQE